MQLVNLCSFHITTHITTRTNHATQTSWPVIFLCHISEYLAPLFRKVSRIWAIQDLQIGKTFPFFGTKSDTIDFVRKKPSQHQGPIIDLCSQSRPPGWGVCKRIRSGLGQSGDPRDRLIASGRAGKVQLFRLVINDCS